MQKLGQKLKILAILVGIFALCGCDEKIPPNAKEANPSKSALSFYTNPLDYLNNIRLNSGLGSLSQNEILDIAALNHAKYVVLNNEISHNENQSGQLFSGVTPQDRAFYAGYNSSVSENLSYNADDMKSAIDGLMSAIYHRFAFLNYEIDEIGIGFFENGKISSYVFEMGNSNIENFCKKGLKDGGFGEFIFGFCKDKNLAMQKAKFQNFKAINPAPFVVYPNLEPALAIFSGEVPDPTPECKILSTPVSIEFNAKSGEIKMVDFVIYDGENELKNTKKIDANSDINGKFSKFQFAVFSREIFKFNHTYKARFDYTQNGESKNIEWEFKTQTPKNHYFIAQNGDNLALLPDMTYDIFISPNDCNDVFGSFKIKYSGEKPEISPISTNFLRVKMGKKSGNKAQIKTDNGKILNLYLKK